ncbi:MAG: hypothetical protein FGF50_10690 [Candidatus Brockarchaeota archaeon]|nr:hypothetical protein [Candidatus Brockarchaeota archaeon]
MRIYDIKWVAIGAVLFKWDEVSGKFVSYKIEPGKLLDGKIGEFLSKNLLTVSEFTLDRAKEEGKVILGVTGNVREYTTWYQDVDHNYDTHAKGVLGCDIGNKYLL